MTRLALLLLTASLLLACGNGVGGVCDSDRDCGADGICCEAKHCDGGMCTFRCNNDRDCPRGTACEHGVCLNQCETDRNCDRGQDCKGSGVCEY